MVADGSPPQGLDEDVLWPHPEDDSKPPPQADLAEEKKQPRKASVGEIKRSSQAALPCWSAGAAGTGPHHHEKAPRLPASLATHQRWPGRQRGMMGAQ